MKLLDRLPLRRKPTLPSGVDTVTVARKLPAVLDASLAALGRSRPGQVAPALLLATSAGVAFWWWTQWARGRAESEAATKTEMTD